MPCHVSADMFARFQKTVVCLEKYSACITQEFCIKMVTACASICLGMLGLCCMILPVYYDVLSVHSIANSVIMKTGNNYSKTLSAALMFPTSHIRSLLSVCCTILHDKSAFEAIFVNNILLSMSSNTNSRCNFTLLLCSDHQIRVFASISSAFRWIDLGSTLRCGCQMSLVELCPIAIFFSLKLSVKGTIL